MSKRKVRVQLSPEEKSVMIELIKLNPSDQNLVHLKNRWNDANPSRLIDIDHLKRLKVTIPEISDGAQFWSSIELQVNEALESANAGSDYEPPQNGFDYNGRKTQPLDAEKIPFISNPQFKHFCFDFTKGVDTDIQKSKFRDHFHQRGMAYGLFGSFIDEGEKRLLDSHVGQRDSWTPSSQEGIWKTVGDAVQSNDFKDHILKQGDATFSDVGKTDDRINPNYRVLKSYFTERGMKTVTDALASLLIVCESLYRSVAGLLPTAARSDSRRRPYAIMHELIPVWFSLLTCKSIKTKVQREHMDDHAIGAGALWGLEEDQYVIVWMYSYEMNLELERIAAFYDFIMTKKPPLWSDEAFWNLVSTIHLRKEGFASERRPTPVKIPLKVRIFFPLCVDQY